ncbi:hypothetical protein [Paenirhodobacter populi]|uniref:Uncharacterized protein n=1 Tax=Paenirhodobacter populi TaxID=2306993 RepID=A0A443JVK9_9RHOB|nr:hypothetical protein [Sinirhodobacter populi]RWR07588.1 hypothetical protein D2T32_10875 [Sinirhodobacter populi]RWR24538.1 hypothetical protein D2T30_01125 [Sinirhodobacter populi]RWR30656.1 hypothetical protein D2T31_06655 [Sinirhodobacter populi]
MRQSLPLTLALAACAAPPVPERAPAVAGYAAAHAGGALIVTRDAAPFTYSDGAEARRAADRLCGGRVESSTEDNFRDGAWIYPRGCA